MAHLEKPAMITLGVCDSAPNPERIRTKSPAKLSRRKHRDRMKKRRSATPVATRTNRMVRFKNSGVPKKLGPRDIGRNKYPEGTKHYEQDTTYFLKEKIHRRARSQNFLQRKRENPVQKRLTVQQTGTPNYWKKPDYYKDEVEKMYAFHNAKRKGWGDSCDFLTEKPWKPRDSRLEALKNSKIPKGKAVTEYGSPNSWKPIAFKYENAGGGFLDEKFWFESSHVHIDDGLSKLIEALPPQKKLALSKLPTPTGYQSKINFLKQLRDLVMREVKRIHREDTMILQMESTAFIDGLSKEIEKAYEKELDEALEEVLQDQAREDDKQMNNESSSASAGASAKPNSGIAALDLDIIFDDNEAKYELDDLDVSDIEDEEHHSLTNKYTQLIQRSSSEMGMYQRKILTMQSVNKLTDLIDGMESH